MADRISKKFSVIRASSYALVASLIFLSGWAIGSGHIILSKDQLFRKSVQKSAPANLDYSSVEQVYDTLRNDYDGQLDQQKLLDGLKSGLVAAAGDTYTEYLNAQAANDFNSQLNGTFEGIGAELGKDAEGNTVIISPLIGFPAAKAGLKAGDIILEVDGQSVSGQSVSEVVTKIRGPKGSVVKLKVIRDKTKQLDFSITREQITVPSVNSKILKGNIGYIQISRFAEDTAKLTEAAANDFKKAGVKGVILDLRNDPGGLLDAAVSVSSEWLKPGQTVLQEKRGDTVIKTYKSSGTPTLLGIPTVVLINEGSASASEITAGALHDNNVAKLLGIKSFGKGSVQQLESFMDGGILKVTIARWYTPAGQNIDKQGITPDKEVKLSDADIKAGHDPQLSAAQAILSK